MGKKNKVGKKSKSGKKKDHRDYTLADLSPALTQAARSMRTVITRSLTASGLYAGQDGVILALSGYTPTSTTYRWTVQPTVFLTTQGRRDYTLFFDAPSSVQHPWRFTAYAGREQQLAFPYYGLGNATPYDSSLEHGSTRYFYRYGRDRTRFTGDVQHSLGRPQLRGLFGVGASIDRINLTPFDSGTTLIQHDLSNKTPPTAHTNFVRAGLT